MNRNLRTAFLSLVLFCLIFSFLSWEVKDSLMQNMASILKFKASVASIPLWLYCIFATIALIFFLPQPLLMMGGILFGFKSGILANYIAGVAAACLSFYCGRWYIPKRVQKKIGQLSFLVQDLSFFQNFILIAGLRLNAIVPTGVVNYGFGLTGISFLNYFIPSAIFVLPYAVFYTLIGYEAAYWTHINQQIVYFIPVLFVVISVYFFYKMFQSSHSPK